MRGVEVAETYFDGASHTQPILEGPLSGSDPLMQALLNVVHARDQVVEDHGGGQDICIASAADSSSNATASCTGIGNSSTLEVHAPMVQIPRLVPPCMLACAAWANPF